MRQDTKVLSKKIVLRGDLGVKRMEEIKANLLAELYVQQKLHITITEVSSLHLSSLQWIYAFSCAAQTEGKEVMISTNLPARFDLLVKASGLKKMFNRFDH